MPTYDLTCACCGHHYERFVPRMIRDDDRVCPECGSPEMKIGVGGGVLGFGAKSSASTSSSCGSGTFS
jgi:putative FmdB family regulatory protein